MKGEILMKDLYEKQGLAALKVRLTLMKVSLFFNFILSGVLGMCILGLFKFDWDNTIIGILLLMIISTALHFILKLPIAIFFH
jgi:uncharacterized membrane protein YjjP (DUF1212 family)